MAKTTAYSGSNAEHTFAQVPQVTHPRSTFNRSSNYKTTMNAGFLVPFFVDEILPGDTCNLSTSIFARMATPIFPVMDNLHLDFFWFFVPNRLVWDKWVYFLGEEETPGDARLAPKYGIPSITTSGLGLAEGSVFDYVGLPTNQAGVTFSALPFRAMNLIWSEFFRDQNLQNRPVLRKDGGLLDGSGNVIPVDLVADFPLLTRQKIHDYFTSCLPWPQKGPTVLLPLGTSAPVTITGSTTVAPSWVSTFGSANDFTFSMRDGAATNGPIATGTRTSGAPVPSVSDNAIWANPALSGSANLAGATAATINELRQAFQIQRLLERDARSGSRHVEQLKSHFGVSVPDFRIQRPEFLAGGSVNVSINPVPNTAPTSAANDSVQGNLAAFATAAGRGGSFHHSFTEHGYLIGFCAVRADLNYQDGLHKMWFRKTRYDFYWPELQAIGEQAVLNKEIYSRGITGDNDVFGYQERWAEYRYKNSIVTGQFRSDSALTLDSWHLSQAFTQLPVLGNAFIQDKPPVSRVVAVPSEPHFLLDAHIHLKHTRVMPVYSVPGLIDHF